MNVLNGLCYGLYFVILGYGLRVAFHWLSHGQLIIRKKTEFLAHAFFQGVFLHVVILNLLQWTSLSNTAVLWSMLTLCLTCLGLILWHLTAAQHSRPQFQFSAQKATLMVLVIGASGLLLWSGLLLPNMAWDSWIVWEGRAEQWLFHGLSTTISSWPEWANSESTIFNYSAHYPDGLSLVYFLPKLIFSDNLAVTEVLNVIAYGLMTMLLVSRVAKLGAPFYLQLFLVVVMYSTPLLNNHLIIQGYADIWLAIYILLIMLTLLDYNDEPNKGLGLSALCYLAMLPMLKLEGWVWMCLIMVSHVFVVFLKPRHKLLLLIAVVVIALFLWLNGGLNITLPFGELVINSQRLEVFHLIDTRFEFVDVSAALLSGFLLQNNWSLLWFGLPFLLAHFITGKHSKACQVSHLFIILALSCFLFLFYFTEASQWALDMTAMNRVVLQLTPCYIYLLFKMITQLNQESQPHTQTTEPASSFTQ